MEVFAELLGCKITALAQLTDDIDCVIEAVGIALTLRRAEKTRKCQVGGSREEVLCVKVVKNRE
jgi:hypothetical protein